MIKKLSDICSFLSGNAWKSSEFTDEGIPIIRINNLNTNDNDFKYWKGDYDKKFLIYEGDLLVSLSGTIKTFQWNGPEALLNQRIVKVIANPETNQDWVYYQISNVIEQIANKGKHAVIRNVSVNDLKNFEVDVPDFQTQNKIVAILDKARALVQKRQLAIDLLDELLMAQFIEMFGNPITNNRKWDTKLLGEIAKLERGRFSPRPRNDPSYFEGNYPFIQTGDISKANFRLYEYTQTLNEKGIAVSKEFNIGTIVIAIVGATIGATAILMLDTYATDSIIGINSNQGKSNNIFLEMILRFYKQVLIDKAPEAARANINLSILNKLEIIQPPIETQDKYSQLSNTIEDKRKVLIKSKSQIDDLFGSILQRSFSGKLNLNISLELDTLLDEIDLNKPENDLFSIITNEEYLLNLVKRLNNREFESQELYDRAKHVAFQLLKEEELITQKYDDQSKGLKLIAK